MLPSAPSKYQQLLVEAERKIAECAESRSPNLDLTGSTLPYLPESLRSLTWLRELDVTNCQLTELPPWLADLQELKVLCLLGCPIQTVPTGFERLSRLRNIWIDQQSVYGPLGEAVGRLTHLQSLYFSGAVHGIPT